MSDSCDDGFIMAGSKKQRHSNTLGSNRATYTPNKRQIESENIKKILCKNMILNGSCQYGVSCMYAHSLDEQNILPQRKRAYEIIKTDGRLNEGDIKSDIELYKTLIELTKLCYGCNAHTCTGGYNCKNGSIDDRHVVCYDDLVYGNCRKNECYKIHLSKRWINECPTNNVHLDNTPNNHLKDTFSEPYTNSAITNAPSNLNLDIILKLSQKIDTEFCSNDDCLNMDNDVQEKEEFILTVCP